LYNSGWDRGSETRGKILSRGGCTDARSFSAAMTSPPAPRVSPTEPSLIETKLRAPPLREELVPRPELVELVRTGSRCKLVLVSAPVGYGKTTFAAEWGASEREPRPFAWVSLDPTDHDPVIFWTYVIEALGRVQAGFGEGLRAPLRRPGVDLKEAVLPRLINELASLPRKVVVVLDDYHVLRGERSHALTGFVLEHLPETVQLVILTRSDPPLSLGRLRARREMVEIRMRELRFGEEESAALLRKTLGFELDPGDVQSLLQRTEGWPAGLYLAALSLKGRPDARGAIRGFAGDNRHVVDYMTSEVLERQPPEVRRFLTRTSILERLTAQLCDAVTSEGGSDDLLERLEKSNLFLVPLDERRDWYRYHHLFGDLLRGELAKSEPDLANILHRRASEWHRSRGFVGEAIRHALAAGDLENAAKLISRNWVTFAAAGRIQTLRGWLAAFGEERLIADPLMALLAAHVSALSGNREEMERWLAIVERDHHRGPLPDGHASLESAVALLRARYGFSSVRAMREAAEQAVTTEDGARSVFRTPARVVLGYSLYFSGKLDAATGWCEEAIELDGRKIPIVEISSLALLSVIASDRGRLEDAESLAHRALRLADEHGLAEHPEVLPTTRIAHGRALAGRGRLAEAEAELGYALEVLRKLESTNTWSMVQLLLALAPVRYGCSDRSGARELLARARSILDACPDAGHVRELLIRQEHALGRSSQRRVAQGEPLTEREAAVLKLLRTDLSQRQIGERLYLSLNTVKSHTRVLYRKLGVSSREEAVAQACRSGLI
jgi:LuxR family transcriptional regulator, maltose regulon positive regulatory protein